MKTKYKLPKNYVLLVYDEKVLRYFFENGESYGEWYLYILKGVLFLSIRRLYLF